MRSSLSVDHTLADIYEISPTIDKSDKTADVDKTEKSWPQYNAPGVENGEQESPDHFIHRDGLCFAGTHLIIDLWQASQLDDLKLMESTMRSAVEAAGATLLHIHLHHFTPNGGISGVAVLAESHISVHTWPERGYAAFDVFMCGDAEPEKTIDVLKASFKPQRVNVLTELRGITHEKQPAQTHTSDQEPTV